MTKAKFWKPGLIIIVLCLSASPAWPKKTEADPCAKLDQGIGFFLLMAEKLTNFSTPPGSSLEEIRLVMENELGKLPGSATADRNLRNDSALGGDEGIVKTRLMGLPVSIDGKKLAEAARRHSRGYYFYVFFYSINVTMEKKAEGKTTLRGALNLEEQPILNLKKDGRTITVMDAVFLAGEVHLAETDKKYLALKEHQYSYNHWFKEKYADFFSGKANALPEGVDYESWSQYDLFLRESLLKWMQSYPEMQQLLNCPAPEKVP